MSSTDRVYRILESELNKNLSFTYTIANHLEPGTRRVIRAGQQFTIEIRARNDSALTMTDVRGAIRPKECASFEQTTFKLERLRAGTTEIVATLVVTIESAPERGYVFDELLSVTLSASADLARFRFMDSGRQVRYAQSTSSIVGERAPMRTARVTIPDRPAPSGSRTPPAAAQPGESEQPRRRRRRGFLGLRSAQTQS